MSNNEAAAAVINFTHLASLMLIFSILRGEKYQESDLLVIFFFEGGLGWMRCLQELAIASGLMLLLYLYNIHIIHMCTYTCVCVHIHMCIYIYTYII